MDYNAWRANRHDGETICPPCTRPSALRSFATYMSVMNHFAQRYTVGVSVGNAGGEPMRNVSGVTGAAPVWHDLMRALHAKSPPPGPHAPRNVFQARVRWDRSRIVARRMVSLGARCRHKEPYRGRGRCGRPAHRVPTSRRDPRDGSGYPARASACSIPSGSRRLGSHLDHRRRDGSGRPLDALRRAP